MKLTKIIAAILLILVLIFSSCQAEYRDSYDSYAKGDLTEQSDDLRKFSSSAEVTEFIKKNINTYNYGDATIRTLAAVDADFAVAESAAAPQAKGGDDGGSASQEAESYSTTNVQIEGVDEADFIKNDGKYIYMILQNKLVIVDAFPGDEAKIISETKLEGVPTQMFVNGDRLVIFTTNFEEVYTIEEFDYIPRLRQETQTLVHVYDISDKEEPEYLKEYSVTGNYFDSRMIGDYVYFIAKQPIYYTGGPVPLPGVRQNKVLINNPEVFYFENPEDSYVFHTVAAFNVFEDRQHFNAKTFMLGYSNTLYVSEDNIYIAYRKTYPNSFYQYLKVDLFFKVVVPLLPNEVAESIREVETDLHEDTRQSYIEAWDKISLLLENMYNYMEEDEKEELIVQIEDAVQEHEERMLDERSLSIIHKLSIERDEITYEGRGEVRGHLLNQFSLDEHNENLRVATTTNFYSTKSGNVLYNNVYVLDKDMNKIGRIEKIAPDEKIYSTRFMGDKLYMVTFKLVDPLFTIDLSDPTNPQILGQLKVPGFSSYLHPYDEDHLIGVGQDTYEENGRVRTKGVKLSLFDVSDFDNPREVDVAIIGDSGSYSEVLSDHKAFLVDKEKNLLVLPVREVSGRYETDSNGFFREKVWNGAYVFTITSNGFKERGKVSHVENEDEKYYWSSPYAVKRALYMDDNLYTVSQKKIKVNDLGTIDHIGSIDLPYDEKWYPYKYYYEKEEVIDEPVILERVIDEPIPVEPDGGIGDGASAPGFTGEAETADAVEVEEESADSSASSEGTEVILTPEDFE